MPPMNRDLSARTRQILKLVVDSYVATGEPVGSKAISEKMGLGLSPDDPEAAKLSGIQTKKVLMAVYTLAGLIAAFAAWVSIGRNGSISPSAAVTDYNLQAITATVIGGISLFGGRGSILGTLFGAMIVGVVSMGLNMLGADPQWKVLLTGVLIIVAVAIDQWIRKVSV